MRFFVLVATCVGLLLTAQAASAASLTISAPAGQNTSGPFQFDWSGTADRTSGVSAFAEAAGTTCAATAKEMFARPVHRYVQGKSYPAGPFSERMTVNMAMPAGSYQLCAYMEGSPDGPNDATASTTLEYAQFTAPPCPTSAPFTVTGKVVAKDETDPAFEPSSAQFDAVIPETGSITVQGDDGSSGGGGLMSGRYHVSARLSDATLAKQQTQLQGTQVTYVVTYKTNGDSKPCTRPDGGRTTNFGVTETRTVVVAVPPVDRNADGLPDVCFSAGNPPAGCPLAGFRARGITALFPRRSDFNSVSVYCVVPGTNGGARDGCIKTAAVTITVTNATKRKFKLPSTRIATGGNPQACGESQCIPLKPTTAMRARLRALKERTKLPVSFKFVIKSPRQVSFTRQVTMVIGSAGPGNLSFRSSD